MLPLALQAAGPTRKPESQKARKPESQKARKPESQKARKPESQRLGLLTCMPLKRAPHASERLPADRKPFTEPTLAAARRSPQLA
jgi:hypothetical protein